MIGKLGWLLAIWLASVDCQDELTKANTAFAVDLYKQVVNTSDGENVFMSPVSISTILTLVSLGAKGTTKEQMKEVLHLGQLVTDEKLKKDYKQLLKVLNEQADNYTLTMVNRLFGRKNFHFKKSFLHVAKKYFRATLEKLDFEHDSEKSRVHINDWVAEQTNNKIKDLLTAGSITPNTVLILINAIYFNGLWVYPFDKHLTKTGEFSISKSNKVHMNMMHHKDTLLNYYKSSKLNCQVLELPYKGNKTSMIAFLPNDVDGLSNLEHKLTGELLNETVSELSKDKNRQRVTVQFPMFHLEETISLKSHLEMMGMVDAFSGADLTGIAPGGGLVLTDAIHKAFVNVTETGTEAAAATAILIGRTAALPLPKIEFIVNRPFMFLIYDKDAETVLFLGRFCKP